MSDYLNNMTAEERRNLSVAFQKESARQEADKLGTSVGNLRQRVVDGKYQWVQQANILKEEERRKQIELSSRPIRALRGGENSLVSLIQKMIRKHEKRINELEQLKHIQSIEKFDLINNIKKIIARTETYAGELAKIEAEIELTKSHNPVFEEAEKLLLLLSQLQQQGETAKMQQLQSQYASLLTNYQNQRKKLMPMIDGARSQRANLQREYWRIMQAHYTQQIRVFEKDCSALIDKVIHLTASTEKTELLSEIDESKVHIKGIVDRRELLAKSTPSDVQPKESEESWDDILPTMPPILDEVEFMIEVLKSIDAKVDAKVDPTSTLPSTGMAYTSKKKR